jgi:Xaa-Pro aminopeptidase
MNSRQKRLCSKLVKEKLDCLLVTLPENISYLVKFSSHDSYLLVSKRGSIYFTDSRYSEEVRPRLLKEGVTMVKTSGAIFDSIVVACAGLGFDAIGFEGQGLTFSGHKRLEAVLKNKGKLIATDGLIEGLREAKGPDEIRKMKRAIQITARALKFAGKAIKPGRKEIEVAADLERFIRYHGASSSAFEIIIASGPNSAYPHHAPGSRKIKNNELVLVDIGVEYQGYKSDLTRVYFLGKISFLAQQLKKTVLKAQSLAIQKIRPGIKLSEIDRVSRDYIAGAGYGDYFGHSLGHGIGLKTHEGPRIWSKAEGVLRAGMVFTVEPGIYLAGKFGIRIEDMVLVTKEGCVVLSGSIHK